MKPVLAVLLAAVAIARAAAQDGDARAGRRLAGARCAVCHGNDGIAQQPDAANLAGQTAIYVANELRAFRSGERKNEQMNIIAQDLTDPQVTDLAAWYAAIEIDVTVPSR